MSEAIQVAIVTGLIAGTCNIIAVIIGRTMSHHEHKQTADDVKAIKRTLNGS